LSRDLEELKKKYTKVEVLGEGDIFGEYSFFSGLSREISARSLGTCTVFKLSREDFLRIVE
jgi:CRP-like cAMP-binding protein